MHSTGCIRFLRSNTILYGQDGLGRTICLVRRHGKLGRRQSREYYVSLSHVRPENKHFKGRCHDGPERAHNASWSAIYRRERLIDTVFARESIIPVCSTRLNGSSSSLLRVTRRRRRYTHNTPCIPKICRGHCRNVSTNCKTERTCKEGIINM